MFENDVAGLDEDATLAAVEGNEHTAVEVEVTRLLLAAHWADLKPGDAVDPHGLPGAERAVQPGGEGTPEIADFAPAELGCSLKTSAGSAKRLMADALDLRHRLPRTWAAARAGQAPTYQARHIATDHPAPHGGTGPAGGPAGRGRSGGRVVGPAAGPGGRVWSTRLTPRVRTRRRSWRRGNGSSGWAGSPSTGCGSSSPRSPPATGRGVEAMIARLAEILARDGDFDASISAAPRRSAS